MAPKRPIVPTSPQPKVFRDVEDIDRGITKLQRRIDELAKLDVRKAYEEENGNDDVVRSNIVEAIREVFGSESPEFWEHSHISIWAGSMRMGMHPSEVIEGREKGKVQVTRILQGLIDRLKEKREEFGGGSAKPASYFGQLNLHSRIADVANERFMDGYPWDAVFAASKALVNYVKERSGQDGLDGAALMRTVFSKNKPILAFNALADQTEQDEQEGMMHLFEGAVLAIRNPGGPAFPEGSDQRALEYISFLSLLAYRVQEAKRPRVEPPTT